LWELEIQTLAIARRAFHYGAGKGQDSEALQVQDPLAAYYLDWSQLGEMDRAGVEDLLDAFWRRAGQPAVAFEQLEAARQVLAISGSECQSENQLRRCYRRAMHRAHPDKGGSDDAARAVEHAYRLLLTELQRNP